MMKIKMKPKIS